MCDLFEDTRHYRAKYSFWKHATDMANITAQTSSKTFLFRWTLDNMSLMGTIDDTPIFSKTFEFTFIR